MAYQSKTYSLSDEVIAWLGTLKDDYGSVNKGLLAMIVLCGPARESIPKHDYEVPRGLIQVSAQPDNRPKNAFCKHCGSRFAGARFATICPECKTSGHTLTPADCPVCGEGKAI